MTFTAVALALAIGMAMGILGGGGSIIAVPAFTFVLHLPPKDAVVGVLTGLVGVGGGFLIVPAIVIGAGLPMQQAAAVSLFVIALAAFSGLAGYLSHVTLAWGFIVPFAAIAAAETLAGATIALRLPQRRLQQAFAVSLVLLGSYVLVQL